MSVVLAFLLFLWTTVWNKRRWWLWTSNLSVSTPVGERSIAISVSVCMFVCLSAAVVYGKFGWFSESGPSTFLCPAPTTSNNKFVAFYRTIHWRKVWTADSMHCCTSSTQDWDRWMFMPMPPVSAAALGDDIMFSGCPFSASVRPGRSCYRDTSWTAWAFWMKLIRNNQQPLPMTSLDSGDQRSKVKATAGRRSGESIHVDAGASKFIYSFGINLDSCSCNIGLTGRLKFLTQTYKPLVPLTVSTMYVFRSDLTLFSTSTYCLQLPLRECSKCSAQVDANRTSWLAW